MIQMETTTKVRKNRRFKKKRSLERYMLSTRKTLQSRRMACWGIINSQPHPICVQGNLAFNLMQTSSLALRYMTQVGKMQFSMDLKADKELNAVEATNKNEQIEELRHNLESISIKKSAQKIAHLKNREAMMKQPRK